jgi:hypothetical protein
MGDREVNAPVHPTDPWAPGVRAADVSVVGIVNGFETADAPPDHPNKTTNDREVLAQFISVMFKNASPDGFISLRLFPDKGSKQEEPIDIEPIPVGDRDLLDITVIRATQAANWHEPAVFCPPVATFRTSKNAKTDNICEGVALSVECDQFPQQARQTLEAILGEPTVVVESGGEWINPATGEIETKVHLHWRLAKPTCTMAEHDTLREARNLATDLVDGDRTNKSIVHPIRWPGSWHRKNEARLARIAASSEGEIDLAEAVKRLRVAAGADAAAGPTTSSKLVADDPAAVKSALLHDDLPWNDWNVIGMATWAATAGSEIGREAFAIWSAKSSKNDPVATENRCQHYKTSPPTKIGFGSLVYLARKHSPGWSYGSAEPATDPVDLWAKFEPPTLPRDVLPKVIEGFAFDRGLAMGCDMGGLAVSALAVCAAAISDSIQLQPKKNDTGWLESARLWVAPVGSPSTMKSPMMAAAVKPLRRIDSEMAKNNQRTMADYNKLSAEERRQKEPPKQTRLMMQDTTIEAAQEILKDSPNGVLSYQDELSGFFGAMDKYSGGGKGAAKDRAFWLESYNGAPYSTNRIGRGSVFIENLSVSILGGIQPEPIRKLAEDGSDDGLLQRLIPIVLRPAVIGRDELPSEAVFDYSALVSNLHQLKPPTTGGIMPAVTTLRFDDGAWRSARSLRRSILTFSSAKPSTESSRHTSASTMASLRDSAWSGIALNTPRAAYPPPSQRPLHGALRASCTASCCPTRSPSMLVCLASLTTMTG